MRYSFGTFLSDTVIFTLSDSNALCPTQCNPLCRTTVRCSLPGGPLCRIKTLCRRAVRPDNQKLYRHSENKAVCGSVASRSHSSVRQLLLPRIVLVTVLFRETVLHRENRCPKQTSQQNMLRIATQNLKLLPTYPIKQTPHR